MKVKCLNDEIIEIPSNVIEKVDYFKNIVEMDHNVDLINLEFSKTCIQKFIDYHTDKYKSGILTEYNSELMEFAIYTLDHELIYDLFPIFPIEHIKKYAHIIQKLTNNTLKKITNISSILFAIDGSYGPFELIHIIYNIKYLDKRLLIGDVYIEYGDINAKVYQDKSIEINTFIPNTFHDGIIWFDKKGYMINTVVKKDDNPVYNNNITPYFKYEYADLNHSSNPDEVKVVELDQSILDKFNVWFNKKEVLNNITIDTRKYIPIKLIIKPMGTILYIYAECLNTKSHHYKTLCSDGFSYIHKMGIRYYRNNLLIYYFNQGLDNFIYYYNDKVSKIKTEYIKGIYTIVYKNDDDNEYIVEVKKKDHKIIHKIKTDDEKNFGKRLKSFMTGVDHAIKYINK